MTKSIIKLEIVFSLVNNLVVCSRPNLQIIFILEHEII